MAAAGGQRVAGEEEEEVQGKGSAIAEALSDGWITGSDDTQRWGEGALIPAAPWGWGGTEG